MKYSSTASVQTESSQTNVQGHEEELSTDSEEFDIDHSKEPSDNGVPCLWDLHLHNNKYLKSNAYRRPRIEFGSLHPENSTHYQRVNEWCKQVVPVPLGPAIPRRDCDETKQHHARLMLLLFKPWTIVSDLWPMDLSWAESYTGFVSSAHPCVLRLIDNMQILHECQDSRDDHFAQRNRE